jgi:hypothetical protein
MAYCVDLFTSFLFLYCYILTKGVARFDCVTVSVYSLFLYRHPTVETNIAEKRLRHVTGISGRQNFIGFPNKDRVSIHALPVKGSCVVKLTKSVSDRHNFVCYVDLEVSE